MSSTVGKTNAYDDYQTPKWCAKRLLEVIDLPPRMLKKQAKWLEPCAGVGNIVRAADEVFEGLHWDLVEIQPDYATRLATSLDPQRVHVYDCDFLKAFTAVGDQQYDVCISNPPYTVAEPFIEKALRLSQVTIMLLRLGFLGSAKRHEFLTTHKPSVYVIPNRPAFANGEGVSRGSGDSADYGWFVWGLHTRPVLEILNLTPVEERR